ncbi:MAG TPA: protein translocase subunit SecD [Anaerolineae bacterium]|nr:protein translocase subunit SecD [Anaerolineae bacterium]
MQRSHLWSLIIVVIVAILALVIALPIQHPSWFNNIAFWQPREFRDLELKQGLDLQGGLQVLLEADPTALAAQTTPDRDPMEAAKVIVENRVNALGVSEPLVQRQGANRIIVELPGIDDPDQAIATLRGTGLLEFVAMGQQFVPAGTRIETSFGGGPSATTGITSTQALLNPETGEPFTTIMTGADLRTAKVGFDNLTNSPLIVFELGDSGRQIFRDYTSQNIGNVVAIVMDKVVLSAPTIRAVIDGSGEISGQFTLDEANSLAVQMQYGALPVALNVVDTRSVGATLGADSVDKSITAGIIGVLVVLLFMVVYYRVPGALADVALILFVLINLAIFKLLPVTLTLPGIAGFLLATGTAVDANVLIFERMKEEVRGGKSLRAAVDAGFNRAWTSIFDSNLSTLITAAILIYFGSAFGASSVRGFAITLAIGVMVSMFTAVFATRVLMRLVYQRRNVDASALAKPTLLGV